MAISPSVGCPQVIWGLEYWGGMWSLWWGFYCVVTSYNIWSLYVIWSFTTDVQWLQQILYWPNMHFIRYKIRAYNSHQLPIQKINLCRMHTQHRTQIHKQKQIYKCYTKHPPQTPHPLHLQPSTSVPESAEGNDMVILQIYQQTVVVIRE